MNFKANRRMPCDRETLWNALNDPEVLANCIPGTQTVTGSLDDGFRARARFKVGPVKAGFKGKVMITDVVPFESYTAFSGGESKATGTAAITVKVKLTEVPGGTDFAYDATAEFGGVLAKMGSMLLNGFAKRTGAGFMDKLEEQIKARG